MADDTKIQFRWDPEDIRFVRELGMNPNEFAREAVNEKLARLRSEDFLSQLRKLQKDWEPWPPGAMARAVRESRDEH